MVGSCCVVEGGWVFIILVVVGVGGVDGVVGVGYKFSTLHEFAICAGQDPHGCGTYPADKYCGNWPRQPLSARPTFSIGFPPHTPLGWPGPTKEYQMGILAPFIRFLPYSAGTGSPVSSQVL